MRRFFVSIALLLCAAPTLAAMQTKPVEWKISKDSFSGVLVFDDANAIKRPGVVMVPDWMGVTDNAVAKAKSIAGDDYVVLVADVYGKNVRPKNDGEAKAQTEKLYADRKVLRARVAKALEVLKAQAGKAPVDAGKLGAIGYC
ncbi:MAG: dienelactone hydrolase family protein, partial [Lysobacter sp.]